ncbi:uncharacterized protein BROUX77_002509 [Berkeleyomyces rouxiae]|uniref:uncharacterized protein n=1 Tax=Berkeleyomyces rouxiae TaxID=2035830 RepID=UPI003B781430
MNNDQFRKLVLTSAEKAAADAGGNPDSDSLRESSSGPAPAPKPRGGFTRKYDSPYDPKASQRMRQAQHQKLFKSAAPKGVKLATGYIDRTQDRHDTDERAAKIQELEQLLKEKKVDQATFEKRRDEITSGNINATHLVKGLDFQLLKRVRQGEDVFDDSGSTPAGGSGPSETAESQDTNDIDDELDGVLDSNVQAVVREKTVKKGQLSTVTSAPSKKRTRDQILADLKKARAAAKSQQTPADEAVNQRFKKIGAKQSPGSRIEIDRKGNEVLIIVDEDGHEKRKIRKAPVAANDTGGSQAEGQDKKMIPDPNAAPLGMEVPEAFQKKDNKEEEDEDINIFDDAGSDYDPLAGLESSSGSDDSDSDGEVEKGQRRKDSREDGQPAPASAPGTTAGPKNYFKDSKGGLASEQSLQGPSWTDPSLQAVLKKAASMKPLGAAASDDEDSHDPEAAARKEKRRKMLQRDDRDAEDMDMGFGTSRFEDEEEADESTKIKLSKWSGGANAEEEEDGTGGGRELARGDKAQRKRGAKKRKGDGNSAADVMRIVEQRRATGQR